jgi:hypothetical protein
LTKTVSDHTSLLLNEKDGNEIRDMIVCNIQCSFAAYIRKVGLHASNVHMYLTGQKPISVGVLKKLLSGTPLQVTECLIQLTLEKEDGIPATTAPAVSLEEELCFHELDMLETNAPPPKSYTSEIRQAAQTILQDFLSLEKQAGS